MLKNSKCHTLDRNNIRAQKDKCGLGNSKQWELAVDLQFNITHWPYIQSSANLNCVERFFADSHSNLQVAAATQLASLSGLVLIVSSLIILLQ